MKKTKIAMLAFLTLCGILAASGPICNALAAATMANAGDRVKGSLPAAVNGYAPKIKLSDGRRMPIVGLGTYSLHGQRCVQAIQDALAAGYRKIDTAHMYDNEKEVGQAIRASGLPREEIFVATKLYPNQYAHAREAVEDALAALDLGYIDLMILHHPADNDVEAYREIEKFVKEGKIRSIGLSNYYKKEIDDFLQKVEIMPVLVQNEIHPYYQEKGIVEHLQALGLTVEAWYPLGGRGYAKQLLADPVIVELAKKYGKSPAQIVLRWNLQRGVCVIPGSSNPEHQQENISVFDFNLSDADMARLSALDRNEKHDWY